MARIRTIKPEFWVDEVMVDLDPIAKLLFLGMLNFVDDSGYIKDSVRGLKMQIFPGNDYDVSGALQSLLERTRVIRFESDQGTILQVAHFAEHQKISHPTQTKFTNIRPIGTPSLEDSRSFSEPSALRGREGKGMEGNGREVVPTPFCEKHPKGTTESCRDCGNARRAFTAWEANKKAQPTNTPPPVSELFCPKHPGMPRNCERCDEERQQLMDEGVTA